ncbi:hypothetical protein QC762_0048920 [Podospora pseudocomata]|uniref:Uncharacterized protein n=1 Tax=Podospora pseudocomata TaxID=2093779 RepID=A0ABR0GHU7_9PEZI|nr:hypothetical protein QC762_0048920 [Podospora pseudocomata]
MTDVGDGRLHYDRASAHCATGVLAPHCGAYLPVVEAQSNIPPKLRMPASLLFSNFCFHRQLSNCNNLPPKLLPLLASISSLKRAASKCGQ